MSAALLDRILDLPLFGEVRSATGAAVGPDERRGFLRGMLALFGLPSALLVALTSFAVPTLTPYANPGLLLTHRAYHDRGGRIWVVGFFLARYNPFSLALLASVALSATLALLVVLDAAQIITLHLITCALVVVVACGTLGLVLQFVFWVLRMRQPSEVITEARSLALNALSHASHSSGLTPRRLDDVDGPFNAEWEEQHEIKLLVDALAQVALRTRSERHPFGPHEALSALADVVEHTWQSAFPSSGRRHDYRTSPRPTQGARALGGKRSGSLGGSTGSRLKELAQCWSPARSRAISSLAPLPQTSSWCWHDAMWSCRRPSVVVCSN